MGNGGDNPFRSGHTAALDLEDLEKQADDGWPNKKAKGEWASKEWSGGKDRWPEDFGPSGGGGGGGGGGFGGGFGGSSGTAALDISEFDGADMDDFGGGGRKGGGGGGRKGGGGSMSMDDDDWDARPMPKDDFDRPGMRSFDGFEIKGDSHTLSMDIEEMSPRPSPGANRLELKRRAERTEDSRNPHTHSDQRGRLSYEGGSGDDEERITRGRGRNYDPGRDRDDVAELADMELPAENLKPHERTMALSVDQLKAGAPLPSAPRAAPDDMLEEEDSLHRTEAIDFNEFRRAVSAPAPPAQLAPHEATQAFDLQAMEDGGLPDAQVPTEKFGDKPSSSPRRMTRPPSSLDDSPNLRTAMIDPREIENMRMNEAESGASLLIFVPGSDPVLFELRPGVTDIGRERTNHLVLSDPFCSRKHLRLKRQGNTFMVRDNGSDNGTLVNHEPLLAQSDRTLGHGDDIIVGSTVLRFISGQPTPADYTPPVLPAKDEPPALTAPTPGAFSRASAPAPKTGSKTPIIPIIVLIVIIMGTLLLGALLIFLFFFRSSGDAESSRLLLEIAATAMG